MSIYEEKDVTTAWLKRLRSGEWTQITDMLGDTGTGRCCLGVLCDVFVDDVNGVVDLERTSSGEPASVVSGVSRMTHEDALKYAGRLSQEQLALPVDVQRTLNVTRTMEADLSRIENFAIVNDIRARLHLGQGRYTVALSQLNDAGFTFEEIAEVIELALRDHAFVPFDEEKAYD